MLSSTTVELIRSEGELKNCNLSHTMEENMMVIIKVIADVEVVSEEEVMVEVITIKPKIKIWEIIKPKVTKIKL